MNKLYICALLTFFFLTNGQAQQQAHYTQYMYNMSILNPAYAGSTESLSLGALHRRQWVGLKEAPVTTTLFGHTRVAKNVGVGLSVISDIIGPVNENNIFGDFSYTLDLGGEHKLALGLKAGVTLHNIGLFSQIGDKHTKDPGDPSFSKDSKNALFNFGSGVYYYTNNYYASLSVPNFIKGTYLNYDGKNYGSQQMHIFLTGGYVFDLNQEFKLKPFFMTKYAVNSPISFDLSVNALYRYKLEFGLTYRLQDSFGAMVNYRITPGLRVGYAYDYIISRLNINTKGSHEFILLYDFYFSKKVSSSPRYF